MYLFILINLIRFKMDEEIDYELLIAQFMNSTCCEDYNKAYEYLGKCNWNIDTATSNYLEDNPAEFYKQYSNFENEKNNNDNKKQHTLLDEIKGTYDSEYYANFEKSKSLKSKKSTVNINRNETNSENKNDKNVICAFKNEVNEMLGLPFEKDLNSVSIYKLILVQKFYKE